jgi:hypothetical protein
MGAQESVVLSSSEHGLNVTSMSMLVIWTWTVDCDDESMWRGKLGQVSLKISQVREHFTEENDLTRLTLIF